MKLPEGVIPPVLTPFKKDLTVDIESAERHMDYLVREGVGGLFVLGSNGEGYDVNKQGRRDMVRAAKNASSGKVPVYACCMGMGTQDMTNKIREIEDLKPDAMVVMLPCYRILKEPSDMEAHFLKLKETTECRMIFYNLPSVTGVSISKKVLLNFAKDEKFIGLKDTSGNAQFLSEIIAENPEPERFRILVGYPWLSAWGCMAGASGIVPSTANIDPEGAVALYKSAISGNTDEAVKLQKRMDKIRDITERYGRELSMKQILVWKGLYSSAVNSSGDTMSAEQSAEFKKAVEKIIK